MSWESECVGAHYVVKYSDKSFHWGVDQRVTNAVAVRLGHHDNGNPDGGHSISKMGWPRGLVVSLGLGINNDDGPIVCRLREQCFVGESALPSCHQHNHARCLRRG